MPAGQPKTGGSQWRGLTECGPLEKGMANQYSCLENPMNSMKRQNNRILNEELRRSVGVPYATGDQRRNNSRKKEWMEPKQKQYPAVDVTGDRSKVRCYKEQYCIGTWNVRSMNQGKFSSVQFSCSIVSDCLRPHESQHARPPCPSPTPGVHSDSRPLSQ